MDRDPTGLPLIASIRERGRLTLPKLARETLSLQTGDRVVVVTRSTSIELIPADLVPRGDAWTLAGSVRARIEAAEDDVSSGRTAVLDEPRLLRETARKLRATGTDEP